MSQIPRRIQVALAVGMLMLPLLFWGDVGPFASRSRGAAWDLGHLVLFFILTVAVLGLFPARGLRTWVRNGLTLLAALVVAVGIEWLQGFIGRNQSVGDVVLSLSGTVLALLLTPWWAPVSERPFGNRWRLVAAITVVATAAAPTVGYLWDEAQARAQMPELASFGSAVEMTRWNIIGEHARVLVEGEPDNWGLQLQTGPGASVSWQLQYFPADWTPYRTLMMRVKLDGDPLAVQCVLNDRAHDLAVPHEDSDHYSERFPLTPGWQEVRIDLEHAASSLERRRMEMTEIASIRCGASDAGRPSALLVDYVRLLP